MRIIKRGIPKANRKYRATCEECGTVFEYREKEATVRHNVRGTVHEVNCPLCAELQFVDAVEKK